MSDLPCEYSDVDSASDGDEGSSDKEHKTDGGLIAFLRDGAKRLQDQGRDIVYSAISDFIVWRARGVPEDIACHAVSTLSGGPSRADSVAIVGAGPAGIHMAYLLKTAGFRVVVFEKTDRIGGKSLSVCHRSAWHEMGTCYMSPDYTEVQQLLNDFVANDQVSVGARTVWNADDMGKHRKCTFRSWIFAEMRKALGKRRMSRVHIAVEVFRQAISYTDLHRRLLGHYNGFLMPRPSNATLKELDCSIEEFLDHHKLQVLKPIFLVAYTLQGYGYLDKTPALYGLLWVTPTLLASLIEFMKLRKHLPAETGSLETRSTGAHRSITTLVKGFQRLWENMVDNLGIQVERNTDITDIRRSERDVRVSCRHCSASKQQQRTFDFLVLATAPGEISHVLDVRDDEHSIVSKLKTSTFITTLFDYEPARTEGELAVDSWFANLHPSRELSVWGCRDTHQLLRHTPFKVKVENPNVSSAVAYQYADRTLDEGEAALAQDKHREHFENHGLRDIKVIRQEVWSYFPHHPQSAMSDGVLWDILQLQGRHRTWYTGSWTCFEAVNAIVSYNKMLVEVWRKQMEEIESSREAHANIEGPEMMETTNAR